MRKGPTNRKRVVFSKKHPTEKMFMQRIERNNLTLRTRVERLARKMLWFLKP
nr:IS1 family transposase [Cedecea neteri]